MTESTEARELSGGVTYQHIRESNLIENIDSTTEDLISVAAWEFLAVHTRLNLEVVLNLHRLITVKQLAQDAGKLRMVDVRVGPYLKMPWEMVSGMLGLWLRTMREWSQLDPVHMHVQFEHIHPFVDGNGRTGRMLMWWHQMKRGEKPVLLTLEKRDLYYEWFTEGSNFELG